MDIYHLSTVNSNNKILYPRIPDNYFTKNGFEDGKTSRVCFAKTIDGALAALSMNLEGKTLYVHVPYEKVKYSDAVNVPDSKITKEVWVREPVKIKCIGTIKVGEAIEKPLPFKYGNNYAELYYWKWRWLKRFNETDKLNESIQNYLKGWGE